MGYGLLRNHQYAVPPSAHTDTRGSERNRSAIYIIPGTGRGLPLQDKVPSGLFGFDTVFDSPPGLGTEKGNQVGSDREIFDAHFLPAGRQIRSEDNGLVDRIRLNAEHVLDQRKHDAVAGPCDGEAAI